MTIHLIANAHRDPVWLWDWREGLKEGLITCRTVLDLMDEHPDGANGCSFDGRLAPTGNTVDNLAN
jgi:hypothetical protein